MGKSKGKIGNVVTATLKGQVIAKSRNFSPANPKTTLQTDSRGKMSNAVMAWQFLSIYLVFIAPFRKSTESTYNAFIRLTKNSFTTVIALSRALAVTQLSGLNFGSSNYPTMSSASAYMNTVSCSWQTNGVPFEQGMTLRVININSNFGEHVIAEHQLTTVEYNLLTIDVACVLMTSDFASAYIYNESNNKCSNVVFSVI